MTFAVPIDATTSLIRLCQYLLMQLSKQPVTFHLVDTVSLYDGEEFLKQIRSHSNVSEVIKQSPGFDDVASVDVGEVQLVEICEQK